MKLIDEDTETPWFESASFLSYEECRPPGEFVLIYYNGEFKGKTKVWTDRSHESRMETRTGEYIILNHTMYYLSDLETNTFRPYRWYADE